jgi:hypothetical protein
MERLPGGGADRSSGADRQRDGVTRFHRFPPVAVPQRVVEI